MLERQPVRGFWIRLDGAWRELRSHQHYAPQVESLLGEAVTASLLLAATLKFQGTLTLQLAGDGLVNLLVAQCTHDFVDSCGRARRPRSASANPGFAQLVGDGRLTVTIEADERASRYQGIVSLRGRARLAECLESYFATSEQLPTRLALAADGQRSRRRTAAEDAGRERAGLKHGGGVQRRVGGAAAAWRRSMRRCCGSAAPSRCCAQVCAEHDCRLFAGSPVRFACRCDAAPGRRTCCAHSGRRRLRSILAEQGAVTRDL